MKYNLPDHLFLKLDYELQQYENESAYDIIDCILLDTVHEDDVYAEHLREELDELAKILEGRELLQAYFNHLLVINTQDDDDL